MELYGFMEREKKIPSYFFIITKRFYDPHFRVEDEVYKVLNLTRNDRKM